MKKIPIQDKLKESFHRHPDRIALEYGNRHTSYRELEKKSGQIARWILDNGVGADTFIGIYLEDKIELISIIVGILKARCGFVPLDTVHPVNRVAGMIAAVHISLVFTDGVYYRRLASHETLIEAGTRIITIDQVGSLSAPGEISYDVNDRIYVYFTSGTTGAPKGIVGVNKSLVHFIEWEIDTFAVDTGYCFSQLSTPGFDAFLRDLFVPLVTGGRLCIPGSRDIIMSTPGLIGWIDTRRIHLIHCVPGIFRIFNNDTLHAGHFKSLKYILMAGERLVPSELKNWYERLGKRVQLVNMYGTSETTMAKTVYFIQPADAAREKIPVGKAIKGARIILLDETMNICGQGMVGEIYIRTPYRTAGYYNDPQMNSQRFIPNPFTGDPDDLFHKTGDLGRVLPDGNLDVIGRTDRQVKVRGVRVEPGEIENQLLKHPRIKAAVVVLKGKKTGDEYLCVYIVPTGPGVVEPMNSITGELKQFLSKFLPDYMVPTYFTYLEKFPLTSNGKIDMKALPEPDPGAAGVKEYAAPGDELEMKLAGIWSGILHISPLGIDDNFFERGGHSYRAMTLTARIQKILHVRIPFGEVFNNPTIRTQAQYIKGVSKKTFSSIGPVEEREYYPLSSAQKRLYILQQKDLGGTVYNMPFITILRGDIDKERLEQSFSKLIARHESLRTSFEMTGGGPVQGIHDHVEFEIDCYGGQVEARNFVRPFDLSHAPLLRVGLMGIDKTGHILMFDMHHIISDGVSQVTAMREFAALYAGKELPHPRIQYKDFSMWQDKERAGKKSQEAYWVKLFKGEIPVLRLPYDYPRPTTQTFEGDTLRFDISRETTAALKETAKQENVTLFMILLALYNILLSKISGQEDILVGTPTAGRVHDNLQDVFGMFVNTLVLRNYPIREKRFKHFLNHLREETLKAFENQEFQYEDLVESVEVLTEPGRNPLFDCVFMMQNMDPPSVEIPGLKMEYHSLRKKTAKFDMIFNCWEAGDGLEAAVEYRTGLFKEGTIKKFTDYFKEIIAAVVEKDKNAQLNDVKISEIELLPDEMKKQLLFDFNDTAVPYPADKTLHELFAEQAAKSPDSIAVVLGNEGPGTGNRSGAAVSYGQLNRKANQLARLLRKKGIKPDHIVGIMFNRSIEMLVGIFGIFKAGGAYLPIDPGYPGERVKYMLADSRSQMLLTGQEYQGKINDGTAVLRIEDETIRQKAETNLEVVNKSSDLAYVVYTSGSTGKPKGTLTCHYNVTRVVRNTNYIDLTPQDRVLQLSNYAFDGSVFDIYGALLNGGPLVIIKPDVVLAVGRLSELIKREEITVFFVTTALFNALIDIKIDCFAATRKILFGGELVSSAHCARALEYLGKNRIIHVYGPTETTVYATYYFINNIDRESATIPIGKPIANTMAYIADINGQLRPIGVVGELWIGGDGVARGYLNNPELTVEKFKRDVVKHWSLENDKLPIITNDRLYKTGDLARWLPDGSIEFLGRKDHQVKIRGYRVEPGEIEMLLLKHDKIREALVIVKEETGKTVPTDTRDKYLCAYFVSDKPDAAAQLREYLSGKLPAYMVPTYLVQLEKMPLTPNGKVDRKALPAIETEPTAPGRVYTAPGNELEKKLAKLWSVVLKVEKIGIYDDFFGLGGQSLKVLKLLNLYENRLNVKLNIRDIYTHPTIARQYELVAGKEKVRPMEIPVLARRPYYELSYSQKRLWMIDKMEPHNPAYNLGGSVTLLEAVDGGLIMGVIAALVQRHEGFRTHFKEIKQEPVQIIEDSVPVDFKAVDLSHLSREKWETALEKFQWEERMTPFRLERAPLLRVKLLKRHARHYELLFIMHHIITDGWSMEVLFREFKQLYESGREGKARNPEPLKIQYKDYAAWHNQLLSDGEKVGKAKEFWKSYLKGKLPVLNLPYDMPRTSGSTGSAAYRWRIPGELSGRLQDLASANHSSLFMVLLAGFNILFSQICGQRDIIMAIPAAARQHEALKNVIGMFVNTLVLRTIVNAPKTFSDFFKGFRADTFQVLEYQYYPMELIFSELKIKYPRLSVFFNMVNFDNPAQDTIEDFEPRHSEQVQDTKFDIHCYLTEYKNGIDISCHYFKERFMPETIEKIARLYIKVLENICDKPGEKIAGYSFTGKKKILQRNT